MPSNADRTTSAATTARRDLARRALEVAIAGTEPKHVLTLFSGGGDSMVAAHVASQTSIWDGCVFIDTGTALPGVIDHASEVCWERDWPLAVIRSPQSYESMIRGHGLPGPGQHPTAYVRLKEKALDAHVRALCSRCTAGERHRKHDTVMWVSGARAAESVRRMGQSLWMLIDGSQVWVNPILDWTDEECETYRRQHGLERSDVASLVHRSGECQCGTYAAPVEREMLRSLFPEFAQRMDEWERLARESGHHHAAIWGERPTKLCARTNGACASGWRAGLLGLRWTNGGGCMKELVATLGYRWRRWRRRKDTPTWDEIVEFLSGGPRA